MVNDEPERQIREPLQGLTTLALLKAHYDAGQDHLGMFVPFVEDTIRAREEADFSAEELQQSLHDRHGITIPRDTLAVLLTRVSRRDHIEREGGRYFRNSDIYRGDDIVDVARERHAAQEEYEDLAEGLIEFAASNNRQIAPLDEALSLLFDFLARFEADIVLGDYPPVSAIEEAGLTRRDYILIAQYIQNECLTSPSRREVLEKLLQGFVLQNAVFLQDIGSPRRELPRLSVYFDSMFLLGAVGVAGQRNERAAREAIRLLKEVDASLYVFERTIREMKRILAAYEHKLATPEGTESLRRTALTSYFLGNNYGPSDVKQVSALLEDNLRQLGVRVTTTPERRRETTYNEEKLNERLRREDEQPDEPRVVHDVACAAAILTLRRGQVPETVEQARALFATTSTAVVRTIRRWYEEEGLHGLPLFIYHRKLTNLAWLRNPSGAVDLKVHELAALCLSALEPANGLWESFVEHLHELEEQEEVTSEERVAIVADELTNTLLVDLETQPDRDADDYREVIRRVRDKYRQEGREEAIVAQEEAANEREARRQLELRIEEVAERGGHWVSWGLYVTLAGAVILGALIGFSPGPNVSLPGVIAAAITTGLSTLDLIKNGFVSQKRKEFRAVISDQIRNLLYGRVIQGNQH